MTTEGYCGKCKVRRDMRNEKRVRMKDGRSGISGICTVCSGRMFKMVGSRAKALGKAKIPKKGKVKINAKRKRRWTIPATIEIFWITPDLQCCVANLASLKFNEVCEELIELDAL